MQAYDEFPHVLHEAGREDVEQTVHAQLANLGKVDQIIALRKETGCDKPEQTS
jgi:hypothetical protein